MQVVYPRLIATLVIQRMACHPMLVRRIQIASKLQRRPLFWLSSSDKEEERCRVGSVGTPKDTATKANHMTIDAALALWSKLHRKPTGCVAATYWFCMRVPSFKPLHLQRYTKNGDIFQHVVAYNGIVIVDLAHGHDFAANYNPRIDGVFKLPH